MLWIHAIDGADNRWRRWLAGMEDEREGGSFWSERGRRTRAAPQRGAARARRVVGVVGVGGGRSSSSSSQDRDLNFGVGALRRA